MKQIIRACRLLTPYLSTALLMVELDNIVDVAPYIGGLVLTCIVVWVVVIYSLFSGYHYGNVSGRHEKL